jgi:hypothetical protein
MEYNDYFQKANWLIFNRYPVPTEDVLKLAEILKNADIITEGLSQNIYELRIN